MFSLLHYFVGSWVKKNANDKSRWFTSNIFSYNMDSEEEEKKNMKQGYFKKKCFHDHDCNEAIEVFKKCTILYRNRNKT